MNKHVLVLVLALALLPCVSATWWNDTTSLAGAAPVGDAGQYGLNVMTNVVNNSLVSVLKYTTDASTKAYLYHPNGTKIAEANFSGDLANFTTLPELSIGVNYSIRADKAGASRNVVCTSLNWGGPIVGTGINFTGVYNGCGSPTKPGSILAVQTANFTPPPPPNTTVITVLLVNQVNGSAWPANVTFTNITGTLSFEYFNITNTGFCVTLTGNGTQTNCTANNGASQFYNASNTSLSVTVPISVYTGTHAARITLQAYRLFLNTSIASFNATNNIVTNQTSSGMLQVLANNGTNNIKVDVQGNYSLNVTCTGVSLTSTSCNATGVYDNKFTIGATNATTGLGINTFVANASNTSLFGTTQVSTTTGNATFQLLQGYYYTFLLNVTGHEAKNVTIPANASTNLYNFTVYNSGYTTLLFINETSNTQYTNVTFTVQVISDTYSQNYTTSTGNLTIPVLLPEDYTFRYWYNPDVPRDYYVTLTPQSSLNLSLYMIDSDVSNIYTPIVQDQSVRPNSDVTMSLLRAYILADNTYEYKVVEMEKTDTNGQAVFRVQPNVINYKFLMCKNGVCFTTQPTKFTASTNTYTLSTAQNPLTSVNGIPSAGVSLTFNNATLTYTFLWADSSNLISQGCLVVKEYNTSGITTVSDSCSTGASGSLIYTVTNTNRTRYQAVGTIDTNTEYSTYTFGPETADFTGAASVFGLTGFIVFIIFVGTISLMALESGADTMILVSMLGMTLLGILGFITYKWEAFVGLFIIALFLVYKLRR